MPQLNTMIWCKLALLALPLFLWMLPPKIMAHTFLNTMTPSPQQKTQLPLNSWAWDWQ